MVSGFIHQTVWMLCYSCIFSFPNLVLEALLVYIALEIGSSWGSFIWNLHYSRLYCRYIYIYTYMDNPFWSTCHSDSYVQGMSFLNPRKKRTSQKVPGTSIMRKTPTTQEWQEFEHHDFSTQGIHGFHVQIRVSLHFLTFLIIHKDA